MRLSKSGNSAVRAGGSPLLAGHIAGAANICPVCMRDRRSAAAVGGGDDGARGGN